MNEIYFLNLSLEAAPIPPSRIAGNMDSEEVFNGELLISVVLSPFLELL